MRSCRCIVAQPVATTRLVGVGIAAMMFHIFVLPRMSPACCLGTGYQMCQQGVFKPCIDFTDGDQSGCELSQDFKARVDRSLGVVSLQCCDVVICLEQVSCIPQTWKYFFGSVASCHVHGWSRMYVMGRSYTRFCLQGCLPDCRIRCLDVKQLASSQTSVCQCLHLLRFFNV